MEESMKAVIGADTSQAETAIKRFNKEVSKISPVAKNASFALQGVNRVIQDLPFGMAAIGNNLEELPNAFRGLSAAAKESGQSIGKVLIASLMGPAGLGIALSAIISALDFAKMGLSGWLRKTKEAKDGTDDFAKAIKDTAEIQDDAVASTQGQIATVTALAAVIENTNKPYGERKRALQELKEINKSYFGDLTLESDKLGVVAQRVKEYTQALVQQAVVKKFSDAIADTAKAVSDQERAVEKARTAVEQLSSELEKQQKIGANISTRKTSFFAGEDVNNAHKINEAQAKLIAAQQTLAEENDKLTQLDVQRIDQTHDLNKAVGEGLKLRNLESETVKKTKEDVDQIRHAKIIDQKEVQKAQELSDIIHGILPTKKAAFEGAAPTSVPLLSENFFKPLTDAEKALDDFNAKLKGKIQDIRTTLFEGLGEAIGGALASGNFGNILGGFLSVLGDAAIELGKIAIAVGVAMTGIKAAFKSLNPALAIGAGIALVALGSFVKSKVGKIPKFAEGGVVTRPTLGLFGEAGPEAVIPLHKAGNMFGNTVNVQGEFRIRGRDLVAVVATGERSLNRIT